MPDLLAGSTVAAADTPPTVSDRQDTSITGLSSTTYAAGGTVCGTAFTAPTTGRVIVHWSSYLDNTTANNTFVSFEVRTGGTVGSGTVVQGADDNVSVMSLNTNQIRVGSTYLVTGLTAGIAYNIRLMHRVTGSSGEVGQRHVIVTPAT